MKMKKKNIIITLLAVCGVVIAVWLMMHYQAKRELMEQFNRDLALRFDDIMDATYPLIDSYATAMKDRADSIEVMAERAKADDNHAYLDAFSISWEQYCRNPQGSRGNAMMVEYEYFKNSSVFTMLTNSGDNRMAEGKALKKLTMAGLMLKEPYFLEYDSVKSVTKRARQHIADCLGVMEPYRSKQTNIRAWRDVTPQKYIPMFEKYNQK